MKVFLSWSGTASHKAALLFRDWLPSVLQNVDPYVSSEDIDKGARWSSDISQELQLCLHGIIFITRENINAPWLNFEAGALSKSLDQSRVTPLLIGIKRSEIQGPLVQFQSALCDKEEIKKLIFTLNRASDSTPITDERLANIFNVWWPQLESELEIIQEASLNPKAENTTRPRDIDILEELLELVRSQQKIINDPSKLLPASYINKLTSRRKDELEKEYIPVSVYTDLAEAWENLELAITIARRQETITHKDIEIIERAAGLLDEPINYLLRRRYLFIKKSEQSTTTPGPQAGANQ